MKIEGARALVIGMAKSGMAAVELLRQKGATVRAMDSKPLLEETTERLRAWNVPFDLQAPEAVGEPDLIVIAPGVPTDLPLLEDARARRIAVIGEVELASYYLQGRSIGVTGSNGKTTTTALIGHILKKSGVPCQMGGNIGTPVCSMVGTSSSAQWNVLELSSFQLETIERFSASVAVALNVTPDHLDRHHTFESYASSKARLFETQQAGDYAVLNAGDAVCQSYASKTAGQVLWFSSTRPAAPGVWLERNRLLFNGTAVMTIDEIPLRGRHNVENAMAAMAAARVAGVSLPAIAAAIRTFPGVEHRLEFVLELDGVSYYNDSKATNVDATRKAIDAFPGGLWLILGGKDKDSDYTPLRELVRGKAKSVLLIGAAARKIESHLSGAAPLVDCGNIEAAVGFAYRHATGGDVVLLAPACASFDQFDNFEHRGRVFKDLVSQLKGGK